MKVEKIEIMPTKKTDAGLWNIFVEEVSLPEGFMPVTQSLVSVPHGVVAGNHKHPRHEVFLAASKGLFLIWEDASGRHEEALYTEGKWTLFSVFPYTPHAVVNKGTEPAILYEWANAKQHDVERLDLL